MSNRTDAIIDALEEVECAAREVCRNLRFVVARGRRLGVVLPSVHYENECVALSAALDKLDAARSAEGDATAAVTLLTSAVEQWAGRFDSEEDINGADTVDWLAEFIENAKKVVGKP